MPAQAWPTSATQLSPGSQTSSTSRTPDSSGRQPAKATAWPHRAVRAGRPSGSGRGGRTGIEAPRSASFCPADWGAAGRCLEHPPASIRRPIAQATSRILSPHGPGKQRGPAAHATRCSRKQRFVVIGEAPPRKPAVEKSAICRRSENHQDKVTATAQRQQAADDSAGDRQSPVRLVFAAKRHQGQY